MKKTISAILSLTIVLSAASCGNSDSTAPAQTLSTQTATNATETSETSAETSLPESTAAETTEPPETTKAPETTKSPETPKERIVLENKMTPCELALAQKRDFSILTDAKDLECPVGIGKVTVSEETQIARIELMKEYYTEEEYNDSINNVSEFEFRAALVNGLEYNGFIPEKGYDGGAISDYENDYPDMQTYFDSLTESYKEMGYSLSDSVDLVRQAKAAFNAVIDNSVIDLPDRYGYYTDIGKYLDPGADYRNKWTLNNDNIAYIKDHTDEYRVYDEELNTFFVVHVTTPPDYDENKSYPVLFMTDGVWRLNDHAELYKAMESGEASDVILVSLGYNYNIDGTDEYVRFMHLITYRRLLLDFITDNLMPYLGENYNIDYAYSTLFGHSMAGVFSHCALCESDKYDNRPFGKYIIASPALWNLYSNRPGLDPECIDTDYGYFDRNDTLDKKVSLFGGALEDPDYSDQYEGHDSTLEGLEHLNERLTAHGADVTYKLYESHHYQYVSDMLLEYIKTEYPPLS